MIAFNPMFEQHVIRKQMKVPRYLPAGESALVIQFGDEISPELNNEVTDLDECIRASALTGIIETVPTYRSLMVYYDPAYYSFEGLSRRLKRMTKKNATSSPKEKKVFRIPVCYGDEYGPDLEDLARYTGLDVQELIRRHSAPEYRIYMLGFLPGFAYLGGLDSSLNMPRLDSPRQSIPAGSVGIGGSQTGIYPLASPGGWRLIGATPLLVYDPERDRPILYDAGDFIQFVPIKAEEFREIKQRGVSVVGSTSGAASVWE